jgi:hypothetical protein
MTYAVHLSDDLLIRSIDAELSVDLSSEWTIDERVYAERHLAACEPCRQRRQEWARSLDLVETAVAAVAPPVPADSRARLETALTNRAAGRDSDGGSSLVPQSSFDVKPTPGQTRSQWWQLAVAASIACAVLGGLALQRNLPFDKASDGSTTALMTLAASENDYLPLPYSSATLSATEAQVVRVEMPVSALREAGIFVPSTEDEYVDADILLGLDGQPQGIRLVNGGSGSLN